MLLTRPGILTHPCGIFPASGTIRSTIHVLRGGLEADVAHRFTVVRHETGKRYGGHMRTAVRLAGVVGVLGLVVISARVSGQAPRAWPSAPKDPTVTPVAGPGWLTRLGVTLSKTSLGRGSGRYGPPEPTAAPAPSLGVPADVALTGADLYRLNCQACHGLEGKGAPSEIKSAVDPVRGVPLDALRAQMKAQNQPPGEAQAGAKPKACVPNS